MQIIGLFSKFKKEKTAVDWSNAYTATPKFYAKPDGSPFGAIALTEGTETILSKMPQNEYAVDGKRVADWKMVLVSTTKDSIIGDCDYQISRKLRIIYVQFLESDIYFEKLFDYTENIKGQSV